MSKWQNTDAGPRQISDLAKAVRDLAWEGRTSIERTGVTGGTEHETAFTSVFGPVRAEVTALEDKIGSEYGWQVTRKNVRQIIAAYAAALPEARKSRPVADMRRTAEQDAGAKAAAAARDAEEQAARDAENALLEQVMAKAPAGAKALIVAEYKQDASEPVTDYFANRATRTVAIGFRCSAREDFRALHAAARQFSETASVTFEERRDNHSMGQGNYLSDHGWDGAGTGWVIKSRSFPCRWLNLTEDAITAAPAPVPAGSGGSGITVSPSSLGRAGVVEIRFPGKPSAEVRKGLKENGFRWAPSNGCWYGANAAYAESVAAGA